MALSDDYDHVILVCTDPEPKEETVETLNEEILVSTTDILVWDLPTILSFKTIKVQAHRSRLIEQSLYFRSFFRGISSVREPCLGSITINWNVSEFLQILKHMYGCQVDIAKDNLTALRECALYFGVETLILKCERFSEGLLPKRTMSLRECCYPTPKSYDYAGSIMVPPIYASSFESMPDLISLVKQNQFGGGITEDPYLHLVRFLGICGIVKIKGASDDAIRLRLFPFSLKDEADNWLYDQPKRSIYTWDDLASQFMGRYFHFYKQAKMRNEITSFVQQDNESLYDAWERFKELLRKCPQHSLPEWLQVRTFYNGLVPSAQDMFDAACGGYVSLKTPEEALDIIETLAVNAANSWSDMQSQRGVLEVETPDALQAQIKVLSQQLARLTQQLSSMQAKAVATPTLDCDFYKDPYENGNYQANQQVEQVNISGQQNSFSQGWNNQFDFSQGPQDSLGNSSFQGQGESFNYSSDRLASLENIVKKLAINTSNFVSEFQEPRGLFEEFGESSRENY